MTLQSWHSAGWIRPHQTSPEEIRDLFSITDTQLTDASNTSISADSRHYLAYNAALKLCAVLLFAEGYRPEKGKSSHQLAIDSVRHILGEERQDDSPAFVERLGGGRRFLNWHHIPLPRCSFAQGPAME